MTHVNILESAIATLRHPGTTKLAPLQSYSANNNFVTRRFHAKPWMPNDISVHVMACSDFCATSKEWRPLDRKISDGREDVTMQKLYAIASAYAGQTAAGEEGKTWSKLIFITAEVGRRPRGHGVAV